MVIDKLRSLTGKALANLISKRSRDYRPFSVHAPAQLAEIIEPCDVLLVEGDQWVSGAIKYLTQSTWSHAALYVGNIVESTAGETDPPVLIEADLKAGVIAVPLSKYADLNTRICRPVGLTPEDKSRVINHMVRNLGFFYDIKNIFDLARYLLPKPPVPARFRRRMIGLGSGDPTRAICSSLIAQAFQRVRYPILPETLEEEVGSEAVYAIRHHSLFAPRDFDVSPYFSVVKPTLVSGFDYRRVRWADADADESREI